MTKEFEFLISNLPKLSHMNQQLAKHGFNGSQRLCISLNSYGIEIPLFSTREDVRKFFTNESGSCEICGNDCKLKDNNIKAGFKQFCSHDCEMTWRSKRQSENNTIHRLRDRKKWSEMVSKRMKTAIAEGRFTPNVMNSWCNSRIKVKINEVLVNVRSSWEAYFQLKNPSFLYEKIRIPYINLRGEKRTYIVDFVDLDGDLYEIKPSSNIGNSSEKFIAAKNYADTNNIKFHIITEEYFKDIDLTLIKGQPDEEKLRKLLGKYENKKNN